VANIKRANASGITKSGTAISDVPDAPTIGAVSDLSTGDTASVAYTAATTGGAATTFTATSSPGGFTGTGSSPITVSGLSVGTAYTFTVTASNSTGSATSGASSSLTLAAVGKYESIASTTVGAGGSSSISFTSIPATYTHLQVRALCQTNRAGYVIDAFTVKFNSDTGSNYSWHTLYGGFDSSPSVTVDVGTSATATRFYWGNSSVSANVFTAVVMDILDYTNTNKYKTIRTLAGFDVNGTAGTGSYGGTVCLSSGNWRNTNAITSIEIASTVSANFTQYTQFALYGIKGS